MEPRNALKIVRLPLQGLLLLLTGCAATLPVQKLPETCPAMPSAPVAMTLPPETPYLIVWRQLVEESRKRLTGTTPMK